MLFADEIPAAAVAGLFGNGVIGSLVGGAVGAVTVWGYFRAKVAALARAGAEAAKAEAEAAKAEAEAAETPIEQWRQIVRELDRRVKGLQQEVDRLNREHDDCERRGGEHQIRIEALTAQNGQQQATINALQEKLTRLDQLLRERGLQQP